MLIGMDQGVVDPLILTGLDQGRQLDDFGARTQDKGDVHETTRAGK